MKFWRLICFSSFMMVIVPGIAQNTLSQKLWNRVEGCYSSFEDVDDDGKIDADVIDDSKNGFLEVDGSWPTCGCGCTNIVGAFKGANGNYTLIEEEFFDCGMINMVSSNVENLSTVFPESILSGGFFSSSVNMSDTIASFYLDIDIPRVGTDMKVYLKTIPFGMKMKSSTIMNYGYSGKESRIVDLSKIRDIAQELTDTTTLQYILDGKFSEISHADTALVNSKVKHDSWSKFESFEELTEELRVIKRTYDLYNQMNYDSLTLGWNRTAESFFVKEKGTKQKKMTFKEFLLNSSYWMAMC